MNDTVIKSFGITTEQFVSNIKIFSNALKKVIEEYLSKEEIEELNNPNTKSRRKRQLIELSNKRMMNEVIKW